MPYDRIHDETDADHKTIYEDTRPVERLGFYVSEDNIEEYRPQPGHTSRDAAPAPDPDLQ